MNVDYDPFEGWEVQGKPRFVLSRGDDGLRGRQGRLLARPRALRQALAVRAGAGELMLRFGVTVLPDPPYQRLVELIVKAE